MGVLLQADDPKQRAMARRHNLRQRAYAGEALLLLGRSTSGDLLDDWLNVISAAVEDLPELRNLVGGSIRKVQNVDEASALFCEWEALKLERAVYAQVLTGEWHEDQVPAGEHRDAHGPEAPEPSRLADDVSCGGVATSQAWRQLADRFRALRDGQREQLWADWQPPTAMQYFQINPVDGRVFLRSTEPVPGRWTYLANYDATHRAEIRLVARDALHALGRTWEANDSLDAWLDVLREAATADAKFHDLVSEGFTGSSVDGRGEHGLFASTESAPGALAARDVCAAFANFCVRLAEAAAQRDALAVHAAHQTPKEAKDVDEPAHPSDALPADRARPTNSLKLLIDQTLAETTAKLGFPVLRKHIIAAARCDPAEFRRFQRGDRKASRQMSERLTALLTTHRHEIEAAALKGQHRT